MSKIRKRVIYDDRRKPVASVESFGPTEDLDPAVVISVFGIVSTVKEVSPETAKEIAKAIMKAAKEAEAAA